MNGPRERLVRAAHTDETITVYQAYSPAIADAAVWAATFEAGTHASHGEWEAIKACSPVRVQWDPDRSLTGERLSRRAIQLGLSSPAVHHYADEWITRIQDITALVHQIEDLARAGRTTEAAQQLPTERLYPLSPALAARLSADPRPEPAASGSKSEGGARL